MEIKNTKFGRGVFATKNYSVGDIIENSPVIVLTKEDTAKINSTLLYDYYFSWGINDDQAAIALGHGSLFNHSYSPNAKYVKKVNKNVISFIAIKEICDGDEVFINYTGQPEGKEPLWFEVDPKY